MNVVFLTPEETKFLRAILAQYLDYYSTLAGSSRASNTNLAQHEFFKILTSKLEEKVPEGRS